MDWYQIILFVLTFIVGGLLTMLAQSLKKNVPKEKLEEATKMLEFGTKLALQAVSYVEQIRKGKEMTPEELYNEAANFFKNMAAKAGLEFTDTQIKGLIEAAVKVGNDFWNTLKE